MKKIQTVVHALGTPRTFWVLAIFAGILTILYLYFVSVTVLSAAGLESSHKKVIVLREEVVMLEEAYLEEASVITMNRAEASGFEVLPTSRISFVTPTGGTVLTYNGN